MPIITDGPALEPQNKGIDEFHAGRGESLGADIAEAFSDLPTLQLIGGIQTERAKGNNLFDYGNITTGVDAPGPSIAEAARPATPRMDIIEANDRVKKAGLAPHLTLPDQPDIPPAQLDIMMARAQARREREATMERGPQSFVHSALSAGTSFLVGAIDPINIASAFIPVMGELRYAKLLESAGEGFAARAAVRASVGAAQGAVGQAALEPLDWWSHTQDGRDFGMSDVLHNVLFGAVLGGALHSGGGAISDAWRGRQGRALYPFGPGEPLENVAGTRLHASVLHEDGITPAALEQHLAGTGPAIEPHDPVAHQPIFPEDPASAHVTPASLAAEAQAAHPPIPSAAVQTIDDLPQRAREDAARAGIANLIDGEPLRVGEMLEAAAKTDPRIAESFEAWHGSPHDVERFDSSRIGTGEGAQTYGHGLYFAENERVAAQYAKSTTGRDFIRKAQELYSEHDSPDDAHAAIAESKDFTLGQKRLLLALERDDWLGFDYPHQAVSAALSDPNGKKWEMSPATLEAIKQVGNMYRVRVTAHPDHFLDWDKPLREQSDHVRSKLTAAGFADEQTGKDIYHSLVKYRPDQGGAAHSAGLKISDLDATPEAASGRLNATGIHGIKYLDQGSRDAGEGTRNFVVFDDKHIEITHKNGEPVNRQEFLDQREAMRTSKHVTAKPPRGRVAADPKTWSLFEFLGHEGGLKPDGELHAIFGTHKGPFVPGFGALVRPTGRTLDDALRLAKDHGYMFDPADISGAEGRLTPNDLLDRLAEENAGRKQYRMDQSVAARTDLEREAHDIVNALHDELEASSGQKGITLDPAIERRVVEIIQKEGEHDVLAAHERAIMEDEERYNAIAEDRRGHPTDHALPGWDVPDVAGRASAGGGEAAAAGGPAGRAGQGPRGDAGFEPRAAGAGDRAAPETQLARDAAWRQLSHARPEFDDAKVIAASNAAAEVKKPPSKLDERLTAAQKADAYAKQMYDMFAERMPEADRQRLDDLIKTIGSDHEAREIAIERGGACLFGARG